MIKQILKRRTKLIIATVVGILMLCFSCALVIVPNEINSKVIADTPAQVGEKKYKGGAVYVGANSTYKMTTGSITGHENLYGGAVYVASGGTFEMTGGEISGNSAKYGGAIYVAAGGKCVHTICEKTKTEDIIPISDEALELIGYSPQCISSHYCIVISWCCVDWC